MSGEVVAGICLLLVPTVFLAIVEVNGARKRKLDQQRARRSKSSDSRGSQAT